MQFDEELARHFLHAFGVKRKVVPRRGVGNHVPTHGICAESADAVEGVDDIAQTLRHLDAVLVEHKTIGNHSLVSHRVEHHRGNGMEREEPSTRLVNTFGNEIGRVGGAFVNQFLVFKRVVNLCVWHGTGIKPHVDEVEFASEHIALVRHQFDVIYIRTVQVYLIVILLTHVARHETLLLQWVRCHHASSHSLLNLVVEFLHAADAHFLASVAVAPDGQWSAPVARTREVPVVEVLEPLAETSRTCTFRLPLDCLVQFKHSVFLCRRFDEPRVKRVVEHRFVGAPAVRVVVYVLLNLEGGAFFFHLQAQHHIEIHILVGSLLVILTPLIVFGVVSILDEVATMFPITFIDTETHELFVHVVLHEILTREVHHRTGVAGLVDDEE